MKIYYKVSFDFEDDTEAIEQAALEGRITNFRVELDHARMEAPPDLWKRLGHVSHCPHCEQRHSGSCQDLPRDMPIVGIDIVIPKVTA